MTETELKNEILHIWTCEDFDSLPEEEMEKAIRINRYFTACLLDDFFNETGKKYSVNFTEENGRLKVNLKEE